MTRAGLLTLAMLAVACTDATPTTGEAVEAIGGAYEDRLQECGDSRRDIAEDFIGAACTTALDCDSGTPITFDLDSCLADIAHWRCTVPGIPQSCYPLWSDS